ncbi:penicillin-binding transpeptidase domain-containing protein, partial [Enterococcus faecalis]
AAAQLIGYTGTITAEQIEKNPEVSSTGVIRKTGLERPFDKELRGQHGGSLVILDDKENVKKALQTKEKKDGQTIKLTIDSGVQLQAFAIFDKR